MAKTPMYPTINIDWDRYGEKDIPYLLGADTILMEMRDAFEGWEEEGYEYHPLEQDDIQECAHMLGVQVVN